MLRNGEEQILMFVYLLKVVAYIKIIYTCLDVECYNNKISFPDGATAYIDL